MKANSARRIIFIDMQAKPGKVKADGDNGPTTDDE
jgi:hypothetical protein